MTNELTLNINLTHRFIPWNYYSYLNNDLNTDSYKLAHYSDSQIDTLKASWHINDLNSKNHAMTNKMKSYIDH